MICSLWAFKENGEASRTARLLEYQGENPTQAKCSWSENLIYPWTGHCRWEIPNRFQKLSEGLYIRMIFFFLNSLLGLSMLLVHKANRDVCRNLEKPIQRKELCRRILLEHWFDCTVGCDHKGREVKKENVTHDSWCYSENGFLYRRDWKSFSIVEAVVNSQLLCLHNRVEGWSCDWGTRLELKEYV